MAEKLTDEQIRAKAEELTAQHMAKVIPVVFEEDGSTDRVIGFIKEPNRPTKIRMLDKSVFGSASAAAEALDICLIREESDPRIYSEASENDKYYMGAAMACFELVKYSVSTFKKK
jgi:hypothetical protein